MKQTINKYQFVQDMDRADNFSVPALNAMFDYLDDNDYDDLDVIELCCAYTEYANLAEYNEEHNAVHQVENVDDIADYTCLITIPYSEGFIIENF